MHAVFATPAPEHGREPILGWRLWRLRRNEEGALRLTPTTPRAAWEPGVAIHARCSGAHTRLYMVFNPELEPTHRSPMPGCTCGVHAMKDVRRITNGRTRGAVVGRVAMWGRVIEHSKGWRAEFAYPSRLRLRCGWRHGPFSPAPDPVGVVETGDELIPLCRDHDGKLAGRRLGHEEVLAELLATYRVEVLPAAAVAGET
jgi:hypothetical protein